MVLRNVIEGVRESMRTVKSQYKPCKYKNKNKEWWGKDCERLKIKKKILAEEIVENKYGIRINEIF